MKEGALSSYEDSKSKKGILEDGLMICINKMLAEKDFDTINDYFLYGSKSSFSLREEVARLLLVASVVPKRTSPTLDIAESFINNNLRKLSSSFFDYLLKDEESDSYNRISDKVEEMELMYLVNNSYELDDCIILTNSIRDLYIANLDQNIEANKLDLRYRESLIELFQFGLDCTLDKIRNGVIKDVSVQARH